jgi:hypothetical protein
MKRPLKLSAKSREAPKRVEREGQFRIQIAYFIEIESEMCDLVFDLDVVTYGTLLGQGNTGTAGEPPQYRLERPVLRQILVKYFNDQELKNLCFDLGIDYENLSSPKEGFARELILCCERRGFIPELVKGCYLQRPNALWPW